MKQLATILFLLCCRFLSGQTVLQPSDTIIDVYTRFYDNGKLRVTNLNYTPGNSQEDVRVFKHGLWIEYFDKNWTMCDSSTHRYYRLVEYTYGTYTGKVYYFNKKGELLKTVRYNPELNGSTFPGTQTIFYHKKMLTSVQYSLSDSQREKGLYIHQMIYYPNGKLKHFTFVDDLLYEYHHLSYSPEGMCIYELKLNKLGGTEIKRKRGGRKEIIETREHDEMTRIVKINGREVRRKTKTM